MKEEFYTRNRWQNWIDKIKESEFILKEDEEDPAAAVFVYAMDDVVLACLKVMARREHDIISEKEAMSTIDDIREIVFEKHESLGKDADLMLESLKTALTMVFASCQSYVKGKYDKKTSLEDLVRKALHAENESQIDDALNIMSQVGARVISGESLPEETITDLPYGLVAELLDGIDAISAAQIGDDSYKEDNGSMGELGDI
ncbi:MAG: DUF2150 family protein [Methanotrichaceae archaeon]